MAHEKEVSFITFGEAMMRYAPALELKHLSPHLGVEPFWRSIGGDELNVCVALSRLGYDCSRYVTAIGDGLDSRTLESESRRAGVNWQGVIVPGERLGTFMISPEEKRVYYNRKHSAFAYHDPNGFNWNQLLSGKKIVWFHMTGITPLTGPRALESWRRGLDAAMKRNIPCSIDFNHRPQLGTLETLWKYIRPYTPRLKILVLAIADVIGIGKLEGIETVPELTTSHEDKSWGEALIQLREKIGVDWLCCCFKKRDSSGLQTRWSSAATPNGLFSTDKIPLLHKPKEDLGGGSAWFSGLVDYSLQKLWEASSKHRHDVGSVIDALRRADLLAALSQESLGDWSYVTRTELSDHEHIFEKKTARVDGSISMSRSTSQHPASLGAALHHEIYKAEMVHPAALLSMTENHDISLRSKV